MGEPDKELVLDILPVMYAAPLCGRNTGALAPWPSDAKFVPDDDCRICLTLSHMEAPQQLAY